MKILLYDTGDVREELNEPIGIELLAAHVQNRLPGQTEVDLKWFNVDGYSIHPQEYDIIGVSIHINGLDVFDRICQLCSSCGFQGRMVAGNSVATFAYEQLLERYPNIICSLGEGEDTFTELVMRQIQGDNDLSGIRNLAYLEAGRLIVTEREAFDLKRYLPPLRVFHPHIKARRGIMRIEASRGCAWNQCSFCGTAHKYNHAPWRPIPLDCILTQLAELSHMGMKTVYFCDEDFIGPDKARFAALVDRIYDGMQAGALAQDMKFFISVKPTDLMDAGNIQVIGKFAHCGLKDLFVGLESGCAAQLKRYHKCSTVAINGMAADKLRELSAMGLSIDIGFIFFDQAMTPADIEENIAFIQTHRLDQLASSLIKPLRIQPFTSCFRDTSAVHSLALQIDDLMYPYQFADKTVQAVHDAYSELKLEEIAYKIQSVYRREMASERERAQAEHDLITLRGLQFSAIQAIAAHYIRSETDAEQLACALRSICARAAKLLLL